MLAPLADALILFRNSDNIIPTNFVRGIQGSEWTRNVEGAISGLPFTART
jgi:hypothetical protein